jgi:uncharacterized protein
MTKKISLEKLKKYFLITEEALSMVKNKVVSSREEDAKEILEMAENYISDAKYFESKGDWILAFGALNYAHGWIDSGVRLGIFDVTENRLFTIR